MPKTGLLILTIALFPYLMQAYTESSIRGKQCIDNTTQHRDTEPYRSPATTWKIPGNVTACKNTKNPLSDDENQRPPIECTIYTQDFCPRSDKHMSHAG